MNIAMTLKRMPTVDMQISDLVPYAGEIIMDATSSNVKIGDGKSHLKDLPWIDLRVDTVAKPTLSATAKSIIEENIDLIVDNEFNKLFDKILPPFQVEVAKALIDSGIDLKAHLFPIPRMLQEVLSDKVDNLDNKIYTHNYSDWSLDYTQMYTKSELDTKLHELTEEVTKKICSALSIPAHLMTIKGEK